MTTTYKVLGQVAPLATTETDVYTVPAATQVVLSTVHVCNRGNTDTTFRLSLSVNGSATATKDFLAYDAALPANDFVALTLGLTLDTADVVRIYAGNNNITVAVFGAELS